MKLSYELAKKLKDAGFPQEINEGSFYFAGLNKKTPFCWGGEGEDKPYGEYILHPTLEELIDACGEKFNSLTQIKKDEWQVVGPYKDKDEIERLIINFNKTPLIAVANLYLALNKKKNDN